MTRRTCQGCHRSLPAGQRGERCGACSITAELTVPPLYSAAWWEQDELRAALGARHFGHLFRAYRKAHEPEVRQATLGRWIGITQGQLSRYERGKPVTDLARLERWSRALHIPERFLWFTLSGAPQDSLDMNGLTRTLERGNDNGQEDDVRRREALRLAALGVTVAGVDMIATPWERVTAAATRGRPADAMAVELVEQRTAEWFRTEETIPARQLFATLRAHRDILRSLLTATMRGDHRHRLLVAAGETDALMGWLLFDRGQAAPAQAAWRSALDIADRVGDGALAACALGYWSYLTSANGEGATAVRMLRAAGDRAAGSSAPATRSWISAREAEESAALGDQTGALRALERATTAFDYARPQTERAWTPFFTGSRLGGLTVTTYTRLRHRDADTAAASLLGSLGPSDNKVRALVLTDLATTAAAHRNYDRAEDLVTVAADLAVRTEASLALGRLRDLARSLPTGERSTAVESLRGRLAVLPHAG